MMRATDQAIDPRVVVASLEQEVDVVVQISVDEEVDPWKDVLSFLSISFFL